MKEIYFICDNCTAEALKDPNERAKVIIEGLEKGEKILEDTDIAVKIICKRCGIGDVVTGLELG